MEECAASGPEASNWRLWCRLCAKDHPENTNVYFKDGENTWTSVLALAIGKYFWVNIKMEDELSNVLCQECYSLVESLIAFSERVNRVQELYSRLRRATAENSNPNCEALRMEYGLQTDEYRWKHILSRPAKEVDDMGADTEMGRVGVKYDEDAEILTEIEEEEFVHEEDDGSAFEALSAQGEEQEHQVIADDTVLVLEGEAPASELDAELSSELHEKEHTIEVENDNEIIYEDVTETIEETEPEAEHGLVETENIGFEEDNDGTAIKYSCAICGKGYKKPMSYKRHMDEAHNMVPGDLPDLSCKRCHRSFPTESQLTAHYRTHLRPQEKSDLLCNYCSKTFTTHAALKRHIAGQHDNLKPYICDCCGKALKTMSALTEHKLVHTDNCPFECVVCHRRFKNKARLKAHADIHTNNNYECDICGMKLNTRRTFNMHKLVHSDEKQYKCDVCGAAFKRGKTLKAHLILHTGIRPYKCNFCGKDFSNGSNCRMHKRKTHPKELAEEESSGVVRATYLPMINELSEASKRLKAPRKIGFPKKNKALTNRNGTGVNTESESQAELDNQEEFVHVEESSSQFTDTDGDGGSVLYELVEEMEVT
ncbi:zinc finger protein weckle [Scaptodrosophila lebanonensis]|uniref:Zinc finger protein weckle n=1 Tax=Drosophila lebanonensis TaxID=7225 RepID=A0A6J2T4Y0_DROLE|nr:zinc finger protein weckle [Scaptodrosophila lebanonensis]